MQSAAALARVRAGRGSRRPYLRHGWSRLPIDWRELANGLDLGLTEAQVRGAIRAITPRARRRWPLLKWSSAHPGPHKTLGVEHHLLNQGSRVPDQPSGHLASTAHRHR